MIITIVPARNSQRVEATVRSLSTDHRIDEVLVVDDGSTDDTAERAARAGATVLSLPTNWGKGGAVAAAVTARPDADVYLLVDADLADTAHQSAVSSTRSWRATPTWPSPSSRPPPDAAGSGR